MTADALLSPAAESGFVFGLGLIFSLGPQNLTLIQAGLTRSHPFTVGDPQQTLGTSETRYYRLGGACLGADIVREKLSLVVVKLEQQAPGMRPEGTVIDARRPASVGVRGKTQRRLFD